MKYLNEQLLQLETINQRRSLREVASSQSREIMLNGQRVLNFCSNNYLGLADDERIKRAAIEGVEAYGVGAGASRLVCGNMLAHETLEKELAAFKKTEACLTFASGYMANVGIISSVVGRKDIVFSDKLNHASIIDGVMLSRAELKRYPHNDMIALEEMLAADPAGKRKLIITDTVFSMDGDVALLKEIVVLARRYKAMVMVDEAHGLGVLGKHGAGLVEQLGMEGEIDIQMGTLSKAAGCFGAYVCGSKVLRDYLINHARSFIYTTAMPPALAQAARCAINIIKQEPQRRAQLKANADTIRQGLNKLGFNTLQSTTPIIPVMVGDSFQAVAMSQRLFEKGIFVQAIRPPTVPVNTARLRLTAMTTHTEEDLNYLLNAMKSL